MDDRMIIKNTDATIPFSAADTTGEPITGLTGITAQIAKDGGAFSAITRTITEAGLGHYWISLLAADTNCETFILELSHPSAEIGDVTVSTGRDVPTVSQIQSGLATQVTSNNIINTMVSRQWIQKTTRRRNQATSVIFRVADSSTGYGIMSLTSTQISVDISKDGGVFSQIPSPVISQIDTLYLMGGYRLALSAADTDADFILLRFRIDNPSAAANPVEITFYDFPLTADVPTVSQNQSGLAKEATLNTAETNILTAVGDIPTAAAIADTVLTRAISDTAPAGRWSLASLIRSALSWTASGTQLKTLKSDGATTAETYTLTKNTNDEITGVK